MNSQEDILKSLGQNIRKARRLKGVENLQEAHELTGIDKDYLGKIERGVADNPTIGTLIKIASAYNVSLEELFIKDGDILSLRFVISEHNIKTLRDVADIIKGLIEKK